MEESPDQSGKPAPEPRRELRTDSLIQPHPGQDAVLDLSGSATCLLRTFWAQGSLQRAQSRGWGWREKLNSSEMLISTFFQTGRHWGKGVWVEGRRPLIPQLVQVLRLQIKTGFDLKWKRSRFSETGGHVTQGIAGLSDGSCLETNVRNPRRTLCGGPSSRGSPSM